MADVEGSTQHHRDRYVFQLLICIYCCNIRSEQVTLSQCLSFITCCLVSPRRKGANFDVLKYMSPSMERNLPATIEMSFPGKILPEINLSAFSSRFCVRFGMLQESRSRPRVPLS